MKTHRLQYRIDIRVKIIWVIITAWATILFLLSTKMTESFHSLNEQIEEIEQERSYFNEEAAFQIMQN